MWSRVSLFWRASLVPSCLCTVLTFSFLAPPVVLLCAARLVGLDNGPHSKGMFHAFWRKKKERPLLFQMLFDREKL